MKSVFIIGSCVSRDGFSERTATLFGVESYVARSSLASALEIQPVQGIELEKIDSPFQRRMVDIDVNKRLESLLLTTNADFILLDSIDERFDLFETKDGAICTVSNELVSSGFRCDQLTGAIIPSMSDAFFLRWEHGWCRLIELLTQRGILDRLRVNRVYWSSTHEDGSNFSPNFSAEIISKANHFLERLYKRMEKDLIRRNFIVYPEQLLVGSVSHPWGSSPYHYVKGFYKFMIDNLIDPMAASRSEAPGPLLTSGRIPLTRAMKWHEVFAPPGATLYFEAVIEGVIGVTDRRALVSIDCAGDATILDGFAYSHDPNVGTYRYLSTGVGKVRTSFSFELPVGCTKFRIGLRGWWPENDIALDWMQLSVLPRVRPATMISIDVEALPGRAIENHVERLIFGRFGDGRSAGIERLCDIFDHFGARATFFVDYSTCVLHGDAGIFKAAELLESRGHDVQLHMHSEVLVRNKNWPYNPTDFPSFAALDKNVAQDCLEFGIEKFERNLGRRPRIFRPGGMKHSAAMYEAARNLGIEAVSALYRRYDTNLWSLIADQPVFQWSNGIKEMPLDFALDPLVSWAPFQKEFIGLQRGRTAQPVASLLIHSTSLLFRDRSGNPEDFIGHHQDYENQLVTYLTWLSANGDFVTYSDVLNASGSLRTVELDRLYSAGSRNEYPQIENTSFAPASTVSAATDADEVTLILQAHLPSLNQDCLKRAIPPTALPTKLATGQRLELVECPNSQAGGSCDLAYVLTGHKAYIQSQRGTLPGGTPFQEAVTTIFDRHPGVELIIAESVLEDVQVLEPDLKDVVRRAFVLDLPVKFEEYRNIRIAINLRRDIERDERRVAESLPGIRFRVLSGADLDKDSFTEACELIEAHLARKLGIDAAVNLPWLATDALANWELYRRQGALIQLTSDQKTYAVALVLNHGSDCYFMAAGHLEYETKYSLGKILIYRLIEDLINKGMIRLHLGGGDFDYKTRFGAIERPLFTFQFQRPSGQTLQARVLRALEAGQSPAVLELDLGKPLEAILGDEFENVLKVDFDMIVENRDLGTDMNSARYQATLREAFFILMMSIQHDPVDVFVDVGCGKGKMLYYASLLGYGKCIGIEIAETLLRSALANLERLQLKSDIKLLQRDASRLDPSELSDGNVFYLYNPFSEVILVEFLRSVVESQKANPRTVRVIYCNSRYEGPFTQFGFRAIRSFNTGQDGWRFDKSVIFERDNLAAIE